MATDFYGIGKPFANILADMLDRAAKAREASYDHVAAGAAKVEADARRAADPDNHFAGLVDFAQFYTKTLYECCQAECPPELVEPAYLLLTTAYNDIYAWVDEQLGRSAHEPEGDTPSLTTNIQPTEN